jgi:ferredoxin
MAQARRDARMLLDGLRGRHPPPLVQRRSHGRARRDEERSSELRPRHDAHDALRAHEARDARHPGSGPHGSAVATVHVQLGDRVHTVIVQPDETILDATLAAGLPMPFSCTLGGCGACKVALRAGAVDMEEPNCLTPAERAAGHVLTCVGRPLGPVTIEVAPG